VNGKNIAAFTTAEEENYAKADVPFDLQTALTEQGAIFHAAEPWSANSIADGNIVTGQNPASAKGVGEKIVALLEAKKLNLALNLIKMDQKAVYICAKWQVKEGKLDVFLDLLNRQQKKVRRKKEIFSIKYIKANQTIILWYCLKGIKMPMQWNSIKILSITRKL
jgi:hypothetical protein